MLDSSLRRLWPLAALVLAMAIAASGASCSSANSPDGSTSSGSTGSSTGGAGGDSSTGSFSTGSTTAGFDVQPAMLQTLDLPIGATSPIVSYTATLDGGPINATWKLDRGDAGNMPPGPASTAVFTPKGTAGGLVNVTATENGQTATRQILIKLSGTQNGADPTKPGESAQIPTNLGDLKAGGGVGGVGGEGLGTAVNDPALLGALGMPTDPTSQGLKFLYPYDKTIWPRGMLAPLVMWSSALGGVDAIQLQLTTSSGSFSWTGTFGPPTILTQSGGSFIRHPIPQDIWDIATNTAGGQTINQMPDTLTLSLVVAKGNVAYGPITQTWRVAPGRLTGSVYYNSYGTQLVKNWAATDSQGHPIGAAILGIRSGDTAPKLVVGQNSPLNASGIPTDDSGCRVCHVVASRGRWLLTQSEQGSPGDGRSYLYDLTAMNVQGSVAQIPQDGVFTWAALTGDASFALTNTINPSSTNPGITNSSGGSAVSSFWAFGAAPTSATAMGLPSPVSAGYPSYSPDDQHIAYVDVQGQTQNFHGPIMAGDYDAASKTFSNIHSVATPTGTQRIGYPVFTPDDKGIIFETQTRTSQSDSVMVTRNGARSELWWVSADGTTTTPLLALNGKDSGGTPYVPVGPNNHGTPGAPDPRSSYDETGLDDTTLNYEPTVLPVVSGGYAWVVFTSRREYGNMLQSVPWRSWPPDYDTTDLGKATVKKLWVAAIDLTAPPGSDPSFPAFYLPAQEILAGNSRGFWVLDPCKPDGQTCETGDQCCGGFCEPDMGGNLVCSPPTTNCSGLQEKCGSPGDCCDPTNLCINGFCAQQVPN